MRSQMSLIIGQPVVRWRLAAMVTAAVLIDTFLMAASVIAQRPMVENFSADEGLPSAITYDLDQDPSGRLWILSRGGVSVYDGRRFATFEDGLPSEPLAALAADAAGRVWTVALETPRLFVLDGRSWRALPPPLEGAGDLATSLAIYTETKNERGTEGDTDAQDKVDGVIAVGTLNNGLLLWNGDGWRRIDTRQGLPSHKVTDLAATSDGLAVATGAGLCLWQEDTSECLTPTDDPRLATEILAVRPAVADPRHLWLLAADWLGYLEADRLTVMADGFDLFGHDDVVFGDLELDRTGDVYFGSPSALYHYDPTSGRLRALGPRDGLASAGTSALLRDREDNLWIASLRGLDMIASQRFLNYEEAHGLFQAEVTAILETAPGEFVLGHPKGVSFVAGDDIETVDLLRELGVEPTARQVTRILDLAVESQGVMWLAGHDLGLLHKAPGRSWKVAEPGRSFAVEIDAAGTVWTITSSRLLAGGQDGFSEIQVPSELGVLGFYRWIRHGPDGRLYLATRHGLVWHQDGRWQRAISDREQAGNVYNLLPEADGTVWVATAVGLYELEDHKLVKVNRGGLRVDRPTYFVLRDPRGWLWMGTDDGVRLWDGQRLRHLDTRHGLVGRETNRGAGFVDSLGQVWIGTDQGVSVYRREYDQGPASPPTVEIRSLEIDGSLHPPDKALILRHDQNTVVVHLQTIGFSPEEEIVVRYRLEGFDEVWQGPTPPTSSEIRYTNLPPGHYRFRAAAAWRGGPWSAVTEAAALTITRPVWQQTWFFVAATAILALTLLGLHAVRVHTIRTHNRRLLEEIAERQRAESERDLLIDDLQTKNRELERFTYTVSHDLKSPLVTIQGFAGLLEEDLGAGETEKVRRDLEHIRQAAGKMGHLLDELLELSRLGRVHDTSEAIELASIAHEAIEMTSGKIAECGVEVEIADDLPVVIGERVRLLEVMMNLIDNAIKFLGDQPTPRIEIGTRTTAAEAIVFVRDNGIGIDSRYHDKVFGLFERLDQKKEGTGIGLAIVQRIVELHGGRIWVESAGPGHGTAFCFTLPGIDDAE